MTTIKKRINLSIGSDVEKMLGMLAKRDRVPQATKATELLSLALEIEEDQIWATIAEKRDKKSSHFVSHEKTWA